MISHQGAKDLLYKHITSDNLRKHHLAAGATMRKFAEKFGEDADKWELVGLLHDMDWEQTKDDPGRHTQVTAEILQDYDVPTEVIEAIKAHHPSASGKTPETLMEKTVYYTEELTGLILAAVLVRPDKQLANVEVKSLKKKLKDKSFARGVDRDMVAAAPDALDLSLDEILQTTLEAMQEIHEELGF